MPFSRGEQRWVLVGAVALAFALGVGLYFLWSYLRDRQVASEAAAEVARELKSLAADHPITNRYGSFVRLEGNGYKRGVRGLGPPTVPMMLERRAVFDKAWAQLTIVVHRGQILEVEHVTMQPDQLGGPGAHPVLQDGEIWMTTSAGGRIRSRLWIDARHPRCPER
jgi:hypothetical protein